MLRNKVSIDAADKRCWGRIHQTLLKKLDWSTSCREAIKDPRTFLIDLHSCREGVEIAIRNSLIARKIARCQGGVDEVLRLFKNSFSRGEKHIYECNQACNSTKDPVNILNSQNHLSTTILRIKIPKTHTHTHTHTHTKQV